MKAHNSLTGTVNKEVSVYDTDLQWEKYGASNPYFGVLADPKFKNSNLNLESRQEFFDSGKEFVDNIFNIIEDNVTKNFNPKKGLEFGCGVGRLLLPLSSKCEHITGVDISDSMLIEAEKNLKDNNVSKFSLFKSDDQLSRVSGKYDLIISFIVLQHIPAQRGEIIINKLLNLLNDGGVAMLHVTYYPKIPRPIDSSLSPRMEMNAYDLNRLFAITQQNKCNIVHTRFTNHVGILGTALFITKGKFDLL